MQKTIAELSEEFNESQRPVFTTDLFPNMMFVLIYPSIDNYPAMAVVVPEGANEQSVREENPEIFGANELITPIPRK